jgi:hypothetical protein
VSRAGPSARLGSAVRSGERSLIKEQIMATQTQQVVEYLKTHPDLARKAMDYVKSHPGDYKNALKDIAAQRGWDLSQIDTATLTKELGNIVPH